MEEWRAARTEIPAEELRVRLDTFVTTMQGLIASLPQRTGEFHLNEVTFSAEVSAKGTVSLLGSGGELAGRAGITFTLPQPRRQPRKPKTSAADNEKRRT